MTQARKVDTAAIYDRFNGRAPKDQRTASGATLRHVGGDGETRVLVTARASKEDVEKFGMTIPEMKAAMRDLGLDEAEPKKSMVLDDAYAASVYARWNAPKKPAE